MLSDLQHHTFLLCGVETLFEFSQYSGLENLTITAPGVAKACMYAYLDDVSTVYMAGLRVHPRFRRMGVGTELQEAREQIGRRACAETSCLCVLKRSWMYDWYERRGYAYLTGHSANGFVWMFKRL